MFTIDQLKRAVTIAEEIQKLEAQLASILGNSSKVSAASPILAAAVSKRRGKRVVSAEARAKMAAAQRARWAKKAGASKSRGCFQHRDPPKSLRLLRFGVVTFFPPCF